MSKKYQTMRGGGESQDMNIFRIVFQTIEHPLPWQAESKLDTGGRYLQELFNSHGQIPRKGKSTNISFQFKIKDLKEFEETKIILFVRDKYWNCWSHGVCSTTWC